MIPPACRRASPSRHFPLEACESHELPPPLHAGAPLPRGLCQDDFRADGRAAGGAREPRRLVLLEVDLSLALLGQLLTPQVSAPNIIVYLRPFVLSAEARGAPHGKDRAVAQRHVEKVQTKVVVVSVVYAMCAALIRTRIVQPRMQPLLSQFAGRFRPLRSKIRRYHPNTTTSLASLSHQHSTLT